MDHLTASKRPWHDEGRERRSGKEESSAPRERIVVDLSPEIEILNEVLNGIIKKYELAPAKKLYDAIVEVEAAIRSLNKED